MSNIKKSDISEKDIFGDIGQSAKEAKGEVDLLKDSLKLISKSAKDLKASIPSKTPSNTAELKKQNEVLKDANLLTEAKIKLDSTLVKAEAKLEVTTKKYREEIAKVRLENAKANKEAKKAAILQDENASAYQKAGIRLADLKRELKDASIAGNKNEQSVKDLREEYDKLNKEIRQTDAELGDFQRNVGNYSSAFDGIGEGAGQLGEGLAGAVSGGDGLSGAITGVIGKLGPWGAAAGAAIGGAVALGSAISDVDQEFDTLRGTIAQLTGVGGAELDRLTASIKSFETTFGAETNESLRAANVLIKEFGLSGDEATKLIEQGFLSNANIQGDLLEGITEYSTQIKAAGGDADDLFKILDASGSAGVFSDKGIDTVKEFGLRIREQTESTSQALLNGFGEEFTTDLFNGINDGSISTVEALQTVTKALEEQDLSVKDRQTIIADVFGGAGEDANSFLETLTEINFETEFAADLSGDLAKQKQKELDANEALATAQNKLSKAIGDSAAISRFWTQIQTFAIEALTSFIIGIENLILGFSLLKDEPIKALKLIFNSLSDYFLIPLNLGIDLVNQLIGLFSDFQIPDLDVNFPIDDLEKFNAEQREANRITRIAAKRIEELEKATIKMVGAEESRVQSLVDGNLSQEDRNELINDLNEKYPELIENYDLENLTQDDAIKLQQELRAEIIETTITKQKSLAISLLDAKVNAEKLKAEKITNERVKEERLKVIEFEKQRQLQRIDNIEEEVRIQLGLKERETDTLIDLDDEVLDNAEGNHDARASSFEKSSNRVISAAEQEEQRLKDLRDQRTKDIEENDKENKKIRDKKDKEEENRVKKSNDQQEKDEENRRKQDKKEEEEKRKQEEADRKESFERRESIIQAFTDKAIESIDKRIDKLDEEIDAAKKQSDFFAELAANGNIQAQQSLAEQNNIIAEAEAEKQKIEQRKQAVQLISSVVLAFNNELGEGATTQEALKEAFLGAGTMSAFIAALPTFFDGTDNTGTHGQGIDGRGGFNAILHPNERVMTSKQNDIIGNHTNDQVAEIMHNYNLGAYDLNPISLNGLDTSNMESKLDNIQKAIQDKPENSIDVIGITKTAMIIRDTKKIGNFTTTSRFKVN